MLQRPILILTAALAGLVAGAQQLPQYSFFTYNYINYNPAVTGFTPCLELRAGYRQQWLGFEGAPRTAFALAHGKFGEKKNRFHGIGGFVENDSYGPFSYTSLLANYAFHFRVSQKYMLSAGLGVGFSQNRVDFSKMTLEDQLNEPVIGNSLNDFNFPQINAGLWLYNPDKFYGISLRQVRQGTMSNFEPKSLRTHLTLVHGRAIKISDGLTFIPAVLMNYVGRSRASIEAQGLVEIQEAVSLGLGVRGGHGISALAKIHMLGNMTLAYAYDLTMSKMRFDTSGSHEIVIGFRACSDKERNHIPCAAYN